MEYATIQPQIILNREALREAILEKVEKKHKFVDFGNYVIDNIDIQFRLSETQLISIKEKGGE